MVRNQLFMVFFWEILLDSCGKIFCFSDQRGIKLIGGEHSNPLRSKNQRGL